MTENNLPKKHPKILYNTGVLLVNLGTPDSYDYFSVRRYLKEFLSDQRVIELNPILWQIILNLFILTLRPRATGKNYKKIWFSKTNESPLKYYTRSQSEKLQEHFNSDQSNKIIVDYAMRYGNPSLESKINQLLAKGCKKIIFLPLYPQYAAATTATVFDEIYRVMSKIRWQPEIQIIRDYPDHKLYIKALINSVKNFTKKLSWQADAILSSYHGIPQEYFKKGDPYQCFCHKTNRLFNEGLQKAKITTPNHISFQSRFGPKEWLKPYTNEVIKDLVKKGVKNLLVITPGFASDCIETLEEVDMEYRELFLHHGGKNFALIPCLNDHKDAISLFHNLVKPHIK
jgi:ferrochelatase